MSPSTWSTGCGSTPVTRVDYVQNVTDVDDPLLERAAATGEDWGELADRETRLFREDMAALRVLPPDEYVGAVEAIPAVIDLIERLRDLGRRLPGRRRLVLRRRQRPALRLGVRPRPATHARRCSASAAATRTRRQEGRAGLPAVAGGASGEPSWDSPFGPGRPGWHIECAAIALDHLGMGFDIQGGGSDLVFPHHEMGASQAQVVTGEWPYARAYVHAGMVGLDGEKMSKSKGNLVFVSRLRADGSTRWRSGSRCWPTTTAATGSGPTPTSPTREARLARWRAAVSVPTGPSGETTLADLRRLLADDLQTPLALEPSTGGARSNGCAAAPTSVAPG